MKTEYPEYLAIVSNRLNKKLDNIHKEQISSGINRKKELDHLKRIIKNQQNISDLRSISLFILGISVAFIQIGLAQDRVYIYYSIVLIWLVIGLILFIRYMNNKYNNVKN